MTQGKIVLKFALLITISLIAGIATNIWGFNNQQALSLSIFIAAILGTLYFWEFRLAIAFLGTAILLLTNTIDLEHVIEFASLDVILFLVGMMVLIGMLKEVGFFAWLMGWLIGMKNLTATKYVLTITIMSALLACAVDEVTSIVFMVAAILETCDYFEINPVPYVIISVLATNIGSSGTVLGNPIGILIASKAGLSFEDFIRNAFPVMLVALFFAYILLLIIYKKEIKLFDEKIKQLGFNEMLSRLVSVPPEKQIKVGLAIFGATLFLISLHHRIEQLLGLKANTVLLIIPLISASGVMIWRWKKARKYIEQDVEWWTLLFFLMLFAMAGTLNYTGVTYFAAVKLSMLVKQNTFFLTGLILWVSAIGSSMLDNVVLVAAFIPIVQSFKAMEVNLYPLWWAMLFGGCFGGNITMIGSTANIVALGILEKDKNVRVNFFAWLKVGLIVGVVTTAVAWLGLICMHWSKY